MEIVKNCKYCPYLKNGVCVVSGDVVTKYKCRTKCHLDFEIEKPKKAKKKKPIPKKGKEMVSISYDNPELPFNQKEWLGQKYLEEKLSYKEIAKLCRVSTKTICRRMQRFNIPARDRWHSLKGELK